MQEEISPEISFPCPTNNSRSRKRPKSVTKVKPGDIDVIAAIGDSLVAANGAVSTNVFQVFIANRGVSWAIGNNISYMNNNDDDDDDAIKNANSRRVFIFDLKGGQENWRKYLTLPNILKEFNPNLIGYSTGDSLYSANRERSQLNAAEPGARSRDLVQMSETLIERIKNHPEIDNEQDWKVREITNREQERETKEREKKFIFN